MRVRRPAVEDVVAGVPRELMRPYVDDFVDDEDVREARAAVLRDHATGHRTGETLDERLSLKLVLRARIRFAVARADYLEDNDLPDSLIPNRGLLPWRGDPPRAIS